MATAPRSIMVAVLKPMTAIEKLRSNRSDERDNRPTAMTARIAWSGMSAMVREAMSFGPT